MVGQLHHHNSDLDLNYQQHATWGLDLMPDETGESAADLPPVSAKVGRLGHDTRRDAISISFGLYVMIRFLDIAM